MSGIVVVGTQWGDEGKGKITISDPSGNIVTLNGDETITISAPKSITMNSKEINILGEDKVHIESKEVIICSGPAGTGKTYIACSKSLKLFKENLKYKKR